MINYKWQIIKIFSKNDLITSVQYRLLGTDQITSIETEGIYLFNDPVSVSYTHLTLPTIYSV